MAGSVSSGFSDDDDGSMSDINVTPLVDVTLVLLIVFMITVPAIVGSAPIKVDLPETSAVASVVEEMTLDFYLKRAESGDLVLYLGERPTSVEDIQSLLKDVGTPASSQRVSLSADRGVAYGEVVKVMDMLQSLGLSKISLDTRHIEK